LEVISLMFQFDQAIYECVKDISFLKGFRRYHKLSCKKEQYNARIKIQSVNICWENLTNGAICQTQNFHGT